jgi:hypothetical protein
VRMDLASGSTPRRSHTATDAAGSSA